MTFEDRSELYTGLGLFVAVLKDQRVATSSEAQRRIAQLGRDARQHPGAEAFLKRAAVLHSDAAVFNDYPMVRTGRTPGDRGVRGRGPPAALEPSAHARQGRRDSRAQWSRTGTGRSPGACSICSRPSLLTIRSSASGITRPRRSCSATASTAKRRRICSAPPSCCPTMRGRCSIGPATPRSMGLPKTQVLLSDDDIYRLQARRNGQRLPRADGRRRRRARHSARGGDRTRKPSGCSVARSRWIRITSRRACAWRGSWNCASATRRRPPS